MMTVVDEPQEGSIHVSNIPTNVPAPIIESMLAWAVGVGFVGTELDYPNLLYINATIGERILQYSQRPLDKARTAID